MDVKRHVGILGGTFNPVHNGHIQLAGEAMRFLHLDCVLFIPTGDSYMKQDVLNTAQRFEMTRLAIADMPYFEISDIESRRTGHSYTSETLAELRKAHPEDSYYFIMGADSLYAIEKWYQPDKICAQCTLVCAVRDDVTQAELTAQKEKLEQLYHAKIILLPISRIDISSSMIRSLCEEGQSFEQLVPPAVYQYIQAHHLYQKKDDEQKR